MRSAGLICFLDLVRGFLLLCYWGNKLQGLPRAWSPPLASLLFSESPCSHRLLPPLVCPAPTPFRLFQRRRFLEPLIPTGEKGSWISLPETPCSGGKALALGRATKSEVYPKEGNGCLCDISSLTIKGLLSSSHTPWAWDACPEETASASVQGPRGETRPAWSCGSLWAPFNHWTVTSKDRWQNTASLCISDSRLHTVTLLI